MLYDYIYIYYYEKVHMIFIIIFLKMWELFTLKNICKTFIKNLHHVIILLIVTKLRKL